MNINSLAPVVSPTCSFTVNQSNALTTRIRSGLASHPFGSRGNLNQLDKAGVFIALFRGVTHADHQREKMERK